MVSFQKDFLKDLFTLRSVTYSLRGIDVLSLPKSRRTTYGLNSCKYQFVKYRNPLPDSIRTIPNLEDFRRAIRQYHFD